MFSPRGPKTNKQKNKIVILVLLCDTEKHKINIW